MIKQKVVFVGGGSCFVPSKIKVMLDKKEFFEAGEICLLDINTHFFPLLIKAGQELCKKANADIKITATTDPKTAFKGATFIYFMWNVGGKEALENDVRIPTSHGISGDETGGIGGTLMAQRNVPVAVNYCKMIERICPEAWIISYTNPTNFIADAIRRETSVKLIPICDSFVSFSMRWLPTVLNMPPFDRYYCTNKDLWPRAIGVNHFTWLVELKVNGKDGYQLLRRAFTESREKFKGLEPWVMADLPIQLFETYGYYNIAPLHAILYYEQKNYLERTKNFDNLFYSDGLGWSKERELQIKKIADGAEYNESPFGVISKDFCFDLSSPRQSIGIMISIIANEGREWGGINFVNNGEISNLPKGSIVEGPVIVNAMGINPVQMGNLPKPFVGLSNQLINWAELSVDAALSGDENILYQAILSCPYVLDMTDAKTIMNEMLKTNYKYLPQYKIKKF